MVSRVLFFFNPWPLTLVPARSLFLTDVVGCISQNVNRLVAYIRETDGDGSGVLSVDLAVDVRIEIPATVRPLNLHPLMLHSDLFASRLGFKASVTRLNVNAGQIQIGSLGLKPQLLFHRASLMARCEKLPHLKADASFECIGRSDRLVRLTTEQDRNDTQLYVQPSAKGRTKKRAQTFQSAISDIFATFKKASSVLNLQRRLYLKTCPSIPKDNCM